LHVIANIIVVEGKYAGLWHCKSC